MVVIRCALGIYLARSTILSMNAFLHLSPPHVHLLDGTGWRTASLQKLDDNTIPVVAMTKREHNHVHLHARSTPGPSFKRHMNDQGQGAIPPPPPSAADGAPQQTTVPMLTVTIEPTIIRTSLTTVYVPENGVASTQAGGVIVALSSPGPTTGMSNKAGTTSSSSDSPSTTLLENITQQSPASSAHTLPGDSSSAASTHAPAATPSTSASTSTSEARAAERHAVIGGLSSAIGGLLLIGVAIAFYLRRRRRKREQRHGHPTPIMEKGFRPSLARMRSEFSGKAPPTAISRWSSSESPVTVDEDHHIIRMSTHHWPRPFAQGRGEGLRDSVAPGQLRVVNADLSRPGTPATMISDTAGSFLKKQRSALTAVILGASRSRTSSKSRIPTMGSTPNITIDATLSRECVVAAHTRASRSHDSMTTTLSTIQQRPPEDPFLTSPRELTSQPRPSATPLQGKSWASFGSTLNPFRTRSSVHRRSSETSERGSTGQWSNPFDLVLDQGSVCGSAYGRWGGSEQGRHERSVSVYTGT